MNIYNCQFPSESLQHAKIASDWLTKFYPDVEIVRHEDHFHLSSALRTDAQLQFIWKTALLAQINHDAAAVLRQMDLEELVR